MKTNNTIFKLLAMTICWLVAGMSAYAADTTYAKTIWVFGSNNSCNWGSVFPGYNVINVTSIGNVTGMDVDGGNGSRMKDNYLHTRGSLKININGNGTLHLLAYGRNSNDDGAGNRTIKIDGAETSVNGADNNKIASPSANDEKKIENITATDERDLVIDFSNNSQWCGVFYVAWEPAVPMTLTLPRYLQPGATSTATVNNGPSGATYTYTSSNTDVATVDASTGAITAVAEGSTIITVTSGTNSVSATLTVDAEKTTTKKAWVFGYDDSKVTIPAGYDNVVRIDEQEEIFNTKNERRWQLKNVAPSINITWNDNASFGLWEDYLHTRAAVTIDVDGPGKFRLLAKGTDGYLGSDKWTNRTLTVKIKSSDKNAELNQGKNQGELEFDVPAAGQITVTGNGSAWGRYYYMAYEPITGTWPVKNSNIKSGTNQPLNNLSGEALGLKTDNTVNTSSLITVYNDNGEYIRSQGALTIDAESPIVATQQGTSNYDLTATATTTNGKLKLTWKPGGSTSKSIYNFTTDGVTNPATIHTEEGNHYISFANGNETVRINNVDHNNNDNTIITTTTQTYKYFYVELTEPTTATIYIAAEYTDGFNVEAVPAGSKFLCVPLNPNKTLSYINIGNAASSMVLHYKSCGYATSDYLPAYAELTNIVVKAFDEKNLNQRNTVVRRADSTVLTPTGTYNYGGRTYELYTVTYGDELNLVPVFTLDNGTVVQNLDYDCNSGDVDPITKDSDGNVINNQIININNSPGYKGEIIFKRTGTAFANISLKNSYVEKGIYNQRTTQRTYFLIQPATPELTTVSGKEISTYTGTYLGLATNNSVDIGSKFSIYLGDEDVTDQGTFSFSNPVNLTLDGSTISSTTATDDGAITVTWTPNAEGATKFNAVTGTITGIKVLDHTQFPIMTINPKQVTIGEGGTQSGITITVKKNDQVLTGTPTWTYDPANIATMTYDSASGTYKVVGNSYGNTTIKVEFGSVQEGNYCSATIDVTVKMRPAIKITNTTTTVKQGETLQMTYQIWRDKNNNNVWDDGEEEITELTPTWSTPAFLTSNTTTETVTKNKTIAYVRVSDNHVLTALNPGSEPYTDEGTVTVTAKIVGSKKYVEATDNITITVTDNTLFDYMGWDLSGGQDGRLYDATDTDKHYIHWRFGAPEGTGVYVYRFQKPNYEFVPEVMKLKWNVHSSEHSFDEFYETRLTDTERYENSDGTFTEPKGDAFLEYNGMIAGYGTEKGGRYMSPISGTFVRIEAEHDGVVTLRVRHNGSVDSGEYSKEEKDGKTTYKNIKQARRALFVIDENGEVMPRTSNYATISSKEIGSSDYITALKQIDGTYAYISPSSTVNDRFNVLNDAFTAWFKGKFTTVSGKEQYTTDDGNTTYIVGSGENVAFSKNAFHFIRSVIYGYSDDQADKFNTEVRNEKGNAKEQELFYSATDDDVKHKAPGVADSTYFFSKYGYEVLGATHLMISFPVKAGKTYFVAANKSKIGMCSVEFMPDETYGTTSNTVTPVDLYEDPQGSQSNDWLLDTADGAHLNVTLHRNFVAGRWHPLVLPFSVSETQLKHLFGDNVAVIALDGGMKMLSSMNNYATRDCPNATFAQYSNTYVTDAGINFNGNQIKQEAIRDHSVTFTRHYYQMIYANCPVFLYTEKTMNEVEFTNVTFQKYTLDKTDKAETSAIKSDYTVTFPYAIDRQIGNGNEYNYVMKASYMPTTPTGEIYYVNNIKSGDKTTAYLYHAQAGAAPRMKATRVWIEPADGSRCEPLYSISMQHFYGDEFGNGADELGICDIIAEQPNEAQWNDETVYDVMGRVVGYGSLDGLRPGIYIYKGTKCYVK